MMPNKPRWWREERRHKSAQRLWQACVMARTPSLTPAILPPPDSAGLGTRYSPPPNTQCSNSTSSMETAVVRLGLWPMCMMIPGRELPEKKFMPVIRLQPCRRQAQSGTQAMPRPAGSRHDL